MRSRTDALVGDELEFQYDLEDRLRAVIANGDVVGEYRYDYADNLLETPQREFHPTGLHRLGEVSYDDRGRATGTPDNPYIDWTYFDLPRYVDVWGQGKTFYRYTASGSRAQAWHDDGSRTDYVGQLYELQHGRDGDERQVVRIYAEGELIAERHSTKELGNALFYVHSDHLGSVESVTDESGNVVERYRYEPFGAREHRIDQAADDTDFSAGFTGHEHDDTGLINARGRVYDPRSGRFLTPDPLIRSPYNRQSLNAYSYVENRPLTWTDPSGLVPCCDPFGNCYDSDVALFGSLAFGAIGAAIDSLSRGSSHDPGSGSFEREGLSSGSGSRATRPVQSSPSRVVDGQGAATSSAAVTRSASRTVVPAGAPPAAGYASGSERQVRDPWLDAANWLDSHGVDDFAAGAGDFLSFGLTRRFRDLTGDSAVVDTTSAAYGRGEVAGVLVSLPGAVRGIVGLGRAGLRGLAGMRAASASMPRVTGAFAEGARGAGEGLGRLAGRSIRVTERGLAIVERHLATFEAFEANAAMVNRLRGALSSGGMVQGADAVFYLHEISEATMVARGTAQLVAHEAALAKYQVHAFSVYHASVVAAMPQHFNLAWRAFWGL
ncbi:RHS repeat domain-containing protein [Sandaracinus amylolyticus]|uniref:Rhs family protein n=1 Tax=Sandaracinus amylolyticus TaxID=927083 RepID=A0A0F6W4H1_9BACT|nr:RHS repeat-associated core domain-containing protein [Sandaracinus amylolyticus]AKF07256.1 Rhs family protein [Sandaracinus amylolyticus]